MRHLFLLAAVLAVPVAAAGPLAVTTRILAETHATASDGTTRTTLAAPGHVGPGDRLVVQLAYRNAGASPIGDVVLADPVPANLAYRGPATGSPAPDVSVDGRSFGPLATLRVPVAGGGSRSATADEVTAVRWRLANPLAAGARGELAFRAVVK